MEILFKDFCNGPGQFAVKSITYDRATNYITVVDENDQEHMAKPWELTEMLIVPDLTVMNAVILKHEDLSLIKNICAIQDELKKNVHEVFDLDILELEDQFTESDFENMQFEDDGKDS